MSLTSIDWGNKEAVLAAVRENGAALRNASQDLKADKEVVLAAIKKTPEAIRHASFSLWADKEVALAAVNADGWNLAYVSDCMKADKEVVLAAVLKMDIALRHASPEIRAVCEGKDAVSEIKRLIQEDEAHGQMEGIMDSLTKGGLVGVLSKMSARKI